MKPARNDDAWALADLDKRRLGERAAVPSAGNDYGAIVAPTLDPMRRPDVLRKADPNEPGEQHSSLWSSSEGTRQGERLVPQITADGRVLYNPDEGQDYADKTGGHLGIYSTPDMADQAAIAMHNYGAEQMQSPSYRPTMWTREDMPGARFRDREAQLKGKPMYGDNQDDEDVPKPPPAPDSPFATSNKDPSGFSSGQLAGATGSDRATGMLAGATGGRGPGSQLGGIGLNGDTRVQAQPDNRALDSMKGPGGMAPPSSSAPPEKVAGVTAALTKPTAATAAAGAPAAASPVAGAAKAAGAGPMAWLGPIASALAAHQQEKQMRRDAAANIGMQYGQSQGEFPTYGYQAARQNRNINDRLGGPGLSGLFGKLAGR